MNKNETDGAGELINMSICQLLFTWSEVLRTVWVNNSKKQRIKIEPLHNQSRKPQKAQAVCPLRTIALHPCYSCCSEPSKLKSWNTSIRETWQRWRKWVKCKSNLFFTHFCDSQLSPKWGVFLRSILWRCSGNADWREGQVVEILITSISKIPVGVFTLARMCSGSGPWGKKKSLSAFISCSQFRSSLALSFPPSLCKTAFHPTPTLPRSCQFLLLVSAVLNLFRQPCCRLCPATWGKQPMVSVPSWKSLELKLQQS